jgi:RNase adaptor protein for sRNA GlmZ degradation
MKPKIYFISGVSGVGKSSAMEHLKKLLPQKDFDIRDFDERGVPDGGGPTWHKQETAHWLEIGTENADQGKSTIICGFNEPERVRAVKTQTHSEVELILLNANGDTIRKRLLGRYPTKESEKEIERAAGMPLMQFAEECAIFAPKLRDLFAKEGCMIIDTDTKAPAEVAQEISTNLLSQKSERSGM